MIPPAELRYVLIGTPEWSAKLTEDIAAVARLRRFTGSSVMDVRTAPRLLREGGVFAVVVMFDDTYAPFATEIVPLLTATGNMLDLVALHGNTTGKTLPWGTEGFAADEYPVTLVPRLTAAYDHAVSSTRHG